MRKLIDTRRLNDSCDILEVWNAVLPGTLEKKGNSHKASCLRPELHNHGDSHPSLLVGGKKNMAWCPVCRSSWNPISLTGEILFNAKDSELRGEAFVKSCLFLSKRFLNGKIPMKDGSWILTDELEKSPPPAILPPPLSRRSFNEGGSRKPTNGVRPFTFVSIWGLTRMALT